MKRLLYFCFCLLATYSLHGQTTLNVRLSGNSYVTSGTDGARIARNGVEKWTNPASVISTYFYLHEKDKPTLSIKAKGHSQISVSYLNKRFKVKLNSDSPTVIPVGKLDIKEPGYVRIDLKGIKKEGETFGEVEELILENVHAKSNYVTDFSEYWGRRGPSVHLSYPMPEGEMEWFYNELTVPEDGEIMHSYYMANGFGEGYFGIQTNSPTERRVLFSVWSPFATDDPKSIPEEDQIKMLRRGEGVHIGEFGNEGSGGQSYLVYPWKAGVTYKFLMHVRPDGKGNTTYTAYFYATDESRWRLIASFMRPKTDTWYKRPHSFLENFNPNQGYLTRKVFFNNQWVRSNTGEWTRLDTAQFTNDATAAAQVRLDYQGGVENDRFFLKMGGFFNERVEKGTVFKRSPSGEKPEIDWEALERLDTKQ